MKKKWTSTFGLAAIIAVMVGAVAWGVWQMQDRGPAQAQDCAEVADHWDRFDCYSTDKSAQTLRLAVESNQPELCEDVEHIFTPHDVIADIEEGIIGSLLEGAEAVDQCERHVEQGSLPRGG